MGKYEVPDGWVVQAYQFALDPTSEQRRCLARQFGGRRYAYNWTVRTLKEDIERFHETSESGNAPSHYGLRKRWNQIKGSECVNQETGEVWWPQVSKEAFSDGIQGAVDAYWNWQKSRAGEIEGRRRGFPRFKKKGRDRDRVTFTTGAIRIEEDRRHVTLPRVGTVRTHENTRRLERLIRKERARILSVTVSRRGNRLVAAFRVVIKRAIQPRVENRESKVGVDVGVRTLATVANQDGETIERVPNPKPLERELRKLRWLCRKRSRQQPGSRRYHDTNRRISKLHRRIANIRGHHIHVLTTRLAKTHGQIVVEGLGAAAMLGQKGLPGARVRRRGLSDSALAEPRRQLEYKTRWYGSELIVADRYYPSSKTCHGCGHEQNIGWSEYWQCDGCGSNHHRDDNAAINLARYEKPHDGDSVLGPVGATVKRGADRKTPTLGAGGEEAQRTLEVKPRDGVLV